MLDCLSLHSALPLLVLPWCSLFAIFVSVSSSFSSVRLLRLEFRTPYSLVGCSDFSLTSVSVLYWILASPFLFFSVFLPCLPFFRSFCFRSPAFFLPIRRFVLSDCVSLHAALSRFLIPFRLVHSCFGASLPSLCFIASFDFSRGFSVLSQLSSSVLSPPSRDSIPMLVCAQSFRWPLPHFR